MEHQLVWRVLYADLREVPQGLSSRLQGVPQGAQTLPRGVAADTVLACDTVTGKLLYVRIGRRKVHIARVGCKVTRQIQYPHQGLFRQVGIRRWRVYPYRRSRQKRQPSPCRGFKGVVG